MKKLLLQNKHVTLRPIKLVDAVFFVRWLSDRDVARYLLAQNTYTLAEEKKWIRKMQRSDKEIIWTIENENSELIGNTGLRLSLKDKRANFGIMIGEKKAWGKGYAGEVLSLLLDYAFKKLKCERFELEVSMDNERGLRAYKKAGFVLEGIRRQYKYNKITKKIEDEGIMSILKTDWLKKNKLQ